MGTASLHFDAWGPAWRDFLNQLVPRCARLDCRQTQSVWRRYRRKSRGIVIQGLRYCLEECMERALRDAVERIASVSKPALARHRVPLGLVLLSRQQLTAAQLRAALAAQRTAGRGRIGEWLQALGFASEEQVTAALARQWSCPVLRANSWHAGISLQPEIPQLGSSNPASLKSGFWKSGFSKSVAGRAPQIPLTLLQSYVMIPVDYVAATATLHLAFGEGIDYGVLYAIEQMVGCHTEFCLAVPSLIRQRLETLAGPRVESEVVFDRVADSSEFSRIVRSYSIRLSIPEIRLAACGPHLWVRLLRPSHPPLDLLLRSPRDASNQPPLPLSSMAPSSVPNLSS
ncbi:MAG TPA: hypothetical protein VKF84_14995 [Candidatus Sulfotelmatobacter sp.]|nr:hypothetical protein [Candidatus Sulfotelmatobacter sp.]